MNSYSFRSVSSEIDSHRSVIEVQLAMRGVPSAIAPVVDQLMMLIKACRCVYRGDRAIEAALYEAFKIVILDHGVEAPQPSDDIEVKCRCEEETEVWVTISLAQGRDAAVRFAFESTGSAGKQLVNHPGIRLIRSGVDEVHVERDGSALHLRKRIRKRPNGTVSV